MTQLINASFIDRYQRSKHSKSVASLIVTRHLLYAYFRLRTPQCLRKRNYGSGLGLLGLVIGLRIELALRIRVGLSVWTVA